MTQAQRQEAEGQNEAPSQAQLQLEATNQELRTELRRTKAQLHAANELNQVLIQTNLNNAVENSDRAFEQDRQARAVHAKLQDVAQELGQSQANAQHLVGLGKVRDLAMLGSVQALEFLTTNPELDAKHHEHIQLAVIDMVKSTNENIPSRYDALTKYIADLSAPQAEEAPVEVSQARPLELMKSDEPAEHAEDA